MLKKLKEMDHHQALRVTHILFFGGLGLMLLSVLIGASVDSTAVMVIAGILGMLGVAAGLCCGFTCVRCPDCRGSLMAGGRVPGSLPRFCPHCGKPL